MERLVNGNLTKWTEYLDLAVMVYRILPHKATRFSPFQLLYNREAHNSLKWENTSTLTLGPTSRQPRRTRPSFVTCLRPPFAPPASLLTAVQHAVTASGVRHPFLTKLRPYLNQTAPLQQAPTPWSPAMDCVIEISKSRPSPNTPSAEVGVGVARPSTAFIQV